MTERGSSVPSVPPVVPYVSGQHQIPYLEHVRHNYKYKMPSTYQRSEANCSQWTIGEVTILNNVAISFQFATIQIKGIYKHFKNFVIRIPMPTYPYNSNNSFM